MSTSAKLAISIILIALGVATRLLPHLWNFVPISAIALFAGVYLGRRYAVILPLAAMLVGDLFLGFYSWPLMLAVYSSFILIGLLGGLVRKYKSLETVIAASIVGSMIFFLVTNWAVWQFSPWYTKDLAGLIRCFTLALPFFRNTLAGDLFYTFILFGAYEGVMVWLKARKIEWQLVKNG